MLTATRGAYLLTVEHDDAPFIPVTMIILGK